MQFQFSEQQIITAVGTVIAAIAAVFGRYLWKLVHSSENGEVTVGWASMLLAVVCGTFGGVNWHLTVPPSAPTIATTDDANVVKAKMQAFEVKKDLNAKEKESAVVPLIAAIPITFLSLPLLLMSLVKLKDGYSIKAQRQEEQAELAKLTALETAKILEQPQKNADKIREDAYAAASAPASSSRAYGAPLRPGDMKRG